MNLNLNLCKYACYYGIHFEVPFKLYFRDKTTNLYAKILVFRSHFVKIVSVQLNIEKFTIGKEVIFQTSKN